MDSPLRAMIITHYQSKNQESSIESMYISRYDRLDQVDV
jgi:hypothetical protein